MARPDLILTSGSEKSCLRKASAADELALDDGAARNASRKRARKFPSRSTPRAKHRHEKDVTDSTHGC